MYEFEAETFVWQSEGATAWHFLRLPLDVADELRVTCEPAGFGSIRVAVRIGATEWTTSVFPEKSSGSYVLPLKKSVRTAEAIEDGSPVAVSLRPER